MGIDVPVDMSNSLVKVFQVGMYNWKLAKSQKVHNSLNNLNLGMKWVHYLAPGRNLFQLGIPGKKSN